MKAFLEVLTSSGSLGAAVANSTAYYNSQYLTPFAAMAGCNPRDSILNPTANGIDYTGHVLAYDFSLYSYVGCRCSNGYDNVYSINQRTGTCQVPRL